MKRMLFCLCVTAFLVLGLAACGGDSAQVEKFVTACKESGNEDVTEAQCRCAAETLIKELTAEQFDSILDIFALSKAAENDPEKAAEIMEKVTAMDPSVLTALENAGRSCEGQ